MSDRFRAHSGRRLWAGVALAAAALFAVGGASAGSAASCGTVTLNEQAWAGSTANTYVAKYVLERTSAAR